VGNRASVRIKYNLGNPFPVTQVDEYEAAVITPSHCPPHQYNLFSYVISGQRPAIAASLPVPKKIDHKNPPILNNAKLVEYTEIDLLLQEIMTDVKTVLPAGLHYFVYQRMEIFSIGGSPFNDVQRGGMGRPTVTGTRRLYVIAQRGCY
jgi:hypothetical protein